MFTGFETIVSEDLSLAKQYLDDGELISIPTETVYGLASNAFDHKAVEKIYDVKRRPKSNPLILHCSRINQLFDFADHIPDAAFHLASSFWPGPLTLLLKKSKKIPNSITGGSPNVAVRIPNHSLTLELLNTLEYPLVAPSANPYNQISPTSSQMVYDYFHGLIPFILDGGKCKSGIESTIINFTSNVPEVLRFGSLTVEMIEKEIGKKVLDKTYVKEVKAPGMSNKHYSPLKPLYVTDNISKFLSDNSDKKTGVLSFDGSKDDYNQFVMILSEKGNMTEAAKNLYECLYILDNSGVDQIVTTFLPNRGLGSSINDRLKRASTKYISYNKTKYEHPFAVG